ncbi:MAG: N-acetylmuramoyl-L-alanine amidase [Paludibacteraceae bacterium]|nr:N-acetylmuramoyl-L-alanine amidase [Paludibacteraceae bacterium]
MRTINEIIVHCSATFPDQVVTIADITRWHRQLGWKTIGYHFLITLAGEIQEGRPIEEVGAHCTGHNANSIGVCYVGGVAADGKPADTRNEAQKQALLVLLKRLKEQFPNATIHGHRDFAQKACPCFDATNEYASL